MQATQPTQPLPDPEATPRIRREALAPEVQRVLDAVHDKGDALIERGGEPEAALVDIVDYRLLRAAARYHGEAPEIGREALERGLSADDLDVLADAQARYDLVLAYFLAGGLTLSAAAGLLGTSYLDLRARLHRLALPTFQGPATLEDALEEARVAESIWGAARP